MTPDPPVSAGLSCIVSLAVLLRPNVLVRDPSPTASMLGLGCNADWSARGGDALLDASFDNCDLTRSVPLFSWWKKLEEAGAGIAGADAVRPKERFEKATGPLAERGGAR